MAIWTRLVLARVYNSPDRPVHLLLFWNGNSSILMGKLDVV